MMERRKRSAMRKSCLHDLLDQEEASEAPNISGSHHRVIVAQEIAERVAQRLASRRPLPPPGKGLLVDYRSME